VSVDVLMAEYRCLWDEKLVHKQELKKFQGYLNYLIPTGSVALAVGGAKLVEAAEGVVKELAPVGLRDFLTLLIFPLALVLPLVAIFVTTEMFHIHVISRHIANLERRISAETGSRLLWESEVSPAVYYRKPVGDYGHLANPIEWGAYVTSILSIAIYLGCLVAGTFLLRRQFVNQRLLATLLFLCLSIAIGLMSIRIMWMNQSHTRPGSKLEQIIDAIHQSPPAGGPGSPGGGPGGGGSPLPPEGAQAETSSGG
jgi:hypothetical protein